MWSQVPPQAVGVDPDLVFIVPHPEIAVWAEVVAANASRNKMDSIMKRARRSLEEDGRIVARRGVQLNPNREWLSLDALSG